MLPQGSNTTLTPRERGSSCCNIDTKSHDQWGFSDQNNILKIYMSDIMPQLNDVPKFAIWMKLGESGEHESLLPFVYICHLPDKITTKFVYKAVR